MNENKGREALGAAPLRNTDKRMFGRIKDVKGKLGHQRLALLLLWDEPATQPISCNAISTTHLLLCNSQADMNVFYLPVPKQMQLLRPASIDELMRRTVGYVNKK